MTFPNDDLPARHHGARSLLLTLLGEFVYPAGGSVWTSTVVRCLDSIGITERNARQAIARLGDQGMVRAERLGRRTRWHLTEHGTSLLATGTERIYSFGNHDRAWDGNWLLVICSIPETQRAIRHRFRTLLTFEGFGFLAPTIAVSPHTDREKSANDIISSLDLTDAAITFVGDSGTATPDNSIRSSAWDLESLAGDYGTFIDGFDTAPEATDAEAAFGATVLLVDAWRRFPFVDPELPPDLLPDDWIGERAKQVFDRRRAATHAAATRWFTEIEAAAT